MNTKRPNEPMMPDPLGFFLTWPTYGTWLTGDDRGWVQYREGRQEPSSIRYEDSKFRMSEGSCILNQGQRKLVESTTRRHCEIRGWQLFAVNCRSNHVHVVVNGDRPHAEIRRQLKAWCTRSLKENQLVGPKRSKWWAERGSSRFLNDQDSLEAAVFYVEELQDVPRR